MLRELERRFSRGDRSVDRGMVDRERARQGRPSLASERIMWLEETLDEQDVPRWVYGDQLRTMAADYRVFVPEIHRPRERLFLAFQQALLLVAKLDPQDYPTLYYLIEDETRSTLSDLYDLGYEL